MHGLIKPPRLRPGGTVGLVTPSGVCREPRAVERGIAQVEALGYRVVLGESCHQSYGYLAGGDALRAKDLNDMFRREDVDAIWCGRGGYGAMRILDRLDYDLARSNPKPLIGYSDCTALHGAYQKFSGLVTFHGPMAFVECGMGPMDPWTQAGFDRMLGQGEPLGRWVNPEPLRALQGGKAQGLLVGGNLSLLAAALGTPYELDVRGKVLFLEEVGEATYRVDRLLTQLRLAGWFEQCAGIVLGGFTDCLVEREDFGLSLDQVFADVLMPSGKPILAGFSCGHCQPNLTLPLGVACALDGDGCCLEFLEGAVC